MPIDGKLFRLNLDEQEQSDNSSSHLPSFLTPHFADLGGEWGNELNKYMGKLLSKIDTITKNPPTAEGMRAVMQWVQQAAGLELVIPSFCMYHLVFAPSMP